MIQGHFHCMQGMHRVLPAANDDVELGLLGEAMDGRARLHIADVLHPDNQVDQPLRVSVPLSAGFSIRVAGESAVRACCAV